MARNNDRERGHPPRPEGHRPADEEEGLHLLQGPRSTYVDYKDVNLLRKFMSDRGKIRARRVSGNCAQHQRDVALAIKTARELALLPYTQRTTSERPGGRGAGRGRRRAAAAPLAAESPTTPDLERCSLDAGSRTSSRSSSSSSLELAVDRGRGGGDGVKVVLRDGRHRRRQARRHRRRLRRLTPGTSWCPQGRAIVAERRHRRTRRRRCAVRATSHDAAGPGGGRDDRAAPRPDRVSPYRATAGSEGRLFGSVTPRHRRGRRAAGGRRARPPQLVIHEPIKTLGTHEVGVRLHPDVEFRLTFEVVSSS